jgi:PAP2 superfamily
VFNDDGCGVNGFVRGGLPRTHTRWWLVAWLRTSGLFRQLVLVVMAALAYFGVRGLTQSGVERAFAHADQVVDLERSLHIAFEATLQNAILDHGWLVTLANWVYIYGHWPVVAGVLTWLFVRHREDYLTLRDAMFISGTIGLVIFIVFPTAPPRLIDMGLLDTVTDQSESYRTLQPPGLINKYAAMPSLHFGWNLLVGVIVYRVARHWWVRAFAIGLPIAMAVAVVATANHYVLDVPAGAAVALTGLALVGVVNRFLRRTTQRWAQ